MSLENRELLSPERTDYRVTRLDITYIRKLRITGCLNFLRNKAALVYSDNSRTIIGNTIAMLEKRLAQLNYEQENGLVTGEITDFTGIKSSGLKKRIAVQKLLKCFNEGEITSFYDKY